MSAGPAHLGCAAGPAPAGPDLGCGGTGPIVSAATAVPWRVGPLGKLTTTSWNHALCCAMTGEGIGVQCTIKYHDCFCASTLRATAAYLTSTWQDLSTFTALGQN